MKLAEINENKKRIWTVNKRHSVEITELGLANLEGCPTKVKNNFYCAERRLKSLIGGPKYVGGNYWCSHNHLTSLEGASQYVVGDFLCDYNQLTNLHNIHKHIKRIDQYFFCTDNDITSHMLGLCLIEGLKRVGFVAGGNRVETIFNRVFEQTQDASERLLEVQERLIDAGLEPYARL